MKRSASKTFYPNNTFEDLISWMVKQTKEVSTDQPMDGDYLFTQKIRIVVHLDVDNKGSLVAGNTFGKDIKF